MTYNLLYNLLPRFLMQRFVGEVVAVLIANYRDANSVYLYELMGLLNNVLLPLLSYSLLFLRILAYSL